MRRFSAVALVAVAICLGGCGSAWAAAPTLAVTPVTVPAGGTVTVTGSCTPATPGTALSSAFLHDATHDFAGVGAVVFTTDTAGNFSSTAEIPAATAPGRYTITARCGGGNLGIQATLTVTASTLAFTGTSSVPVAFAGLLLLIAGALIVGAARRRPTPRSSDRALDRAARRASSGA
jgi:hypothetical protein